MVCHDCLNRIPLEGSECDVLEDVNDVNEAIRKNHCEFYIKGTTSKSVNLFSPFFRHEAEHRLDLPED